jgi:hypothetical protein
MSLATYAPNIEDLDDHERRNRSNVSAELADPTRMKCGLALGSHPEIEGPREPESAR